MIIIQFAIGTWYVSRMNKFEYIIVELGKIVLLLAQEMSVRSLFFHLLETTVSLK